MALTRFKNHSDYALNIWLNSSPNSGHARDEQRFMAFAKSVARYRNKKWLKYENFEKALKDNKHYFEEDEIDKYYYKLLAFVEFYRTNPVQSVAPSGKNGYGYYQRGVIKGRMYEVPISEEEYFTGASKETLAKAEFFDD
jgi:hypothetical protein